MVDLPWQLRSPVPSSCPVERLQPSRGMHLAEEVQLLPHALDAPAVHSPTRLGWVPRLGPGSVDVRGRGGRVTDRSPVAISVSLPSQESPPPRWDPQLRGLCHSPTLRLSWNALKTGGFSPTPTSRSRLSSLRLLRLLSRPPVLLSCLFVEALAAVPAPTAGSSFSSVVALRGAPGLVSGP